MNRGPVISLYHYWKLLVNKFEPKLCTSNTEKEDFIFYIKGLSANNMLNFCTQKVPQLLICFFGI